MTYISDIFINLNYNYFEFYEWNKKDYIEHIKKIPIIKISNKAFSDIINYNVKIQDNFLSNYVLKAEKYNSTKKYNYLVLTNCNNAMVIYFNKEGNILKKSSLIFEDEDNICNLAKELKYVKIKYLINKKNNNKYLTRFEKERLHFILKNITKISNNRLKYLYYDCFNKQENNIKIIINRILKELNNNNHDVYLKSNNLFSLIYQQNK